MPRGHTEKVWNPIQRNHGLRASAFYGAKGEEYKLQGSMVVVLQFKVNRDKIWNKLTWKLLLARRCYLEIWLIPKAGYEGLGPELPDLDHRDRNGKLSFTLDDQTKSMLRQQKIMTLGQGGKDALDRKKVLLWREKNVWQNTSKVLGFQVLSGC